MRKFDQNYQNLTKISNFRIKLLKFNHNYQNSTNYSKVPPKNDIRPKHNGSFWKTFALFFGYLRELKKSEKIENMALKLLKNGPKG